MIVDAFEDFCSRVSVPFDDCWRHIISVLRRPGAARLQELVAMVPIGECRGWDKEAGVVSAWAEHRDLFPVSPSALTLTIAASGRTPSTSCAACG
jgi:hypothetical protein